MKMLLTMRICRKWISYSFGLTGENSLYNKQNKLKNKLGIAISLRKYLADLIVQHSTNL